MTDDQTRFDLLFDCERKAVGCVLLQAAAGCDYNLVRRFGFDTKAWLTFPTPGLRRIRGTADEWLKAAQIANREHGAKP